MTDDTDRNDVDDRSDAGDRNDAGDRSGADRTDASPSPGHTQQENERDGGGFGRDAGSSVDYERFGKLGGAVFGLVGLGTALTMFLFSTLGSSGTTLGTGFAGGASAGNELFFAVVSTFGVVVQLGAVVAVALGVLVARLDDADGSAPQLAAVAAGVGAGATLLVLVVLLVGLAPAGTQIDVVDLLGPVVGGTVGIAATAAGTAYLSNRLPDL